MNPVKGKQIRWPPKDITSAISLRSVSPKAFMYLKANNYPPPALSTLRSWVSAFNVTQGPKRGYFIYKKKSFDMNETDRICFMKFTFPIKLTLIKDLNRLQVHTKPAILL